jgi:hypothetical protein
MTPSCPEKPFLGSTSIAAVTYIFVRSQMLLMGLGGCIAQTMLYANPSTCKRLGESAAVCCIIPSRKL